MRLSFATFVLSAAICGCAIAPPAEPPLNPQAAQLLAQFRRASVTALPSPSDDADWVAAARKGYRQVIPLAGEPAGIRSIEDIVIETEQTAIPARLYRPSSAGTAPLIVYFHGGGFTGGDLDTHDAPLRDLAIASNAVILSVGYRLAPEHSYPAAIDDAYGAFVWMQRNAETLGGERARIILMGDSAGGNIAAATAIRVRDTGGPAPAGQILIYPNTDLRLDRAYPSISAFDGYVINRRDMDRNIRLYTRSAVDRASPYASPIAAEDLTGLPRTLVITAGADPLRDEGEAYASRLRDAGVHVTLSRYPGMVHGFFQMKGALDATDTLIDELAAAVRLVAGTEGSQ